MHEKRSEEHTSELQSRLHLVCRLLLEKKKKTTFRIPSTSDLLTLPRSSRELPSLLPGVYSSTGVSESVPDPTILTTSAICTAPGGYPDAGREAWIVPGGTPASLVTERRSRRHLTTRGAVANCLRKWEVSPLTCGRSYPILEVVQNFFKGPR